MPQDRDFNFNLRFAGFDKLSPSMAKIQKNIGETSKDLRAFKKVEKQFAEFKTLRQNSKKTQEDLKGLSENAAVLGRELSSTANPTKKMVADFKRAQKAVQSLKTQQAREIQELAKLGKSLKAAGYNTSNFSEGQRKLKSDMARANRELDTQRRKLRSLSDQYRESKAAREKFDKSLQTSSNLAIVGASGVAVGDRTLKGVFGLAESVRELSRAQGELKTMGLTDLDIEALKPQFSKLASDLAYVTEESLARAHYTTISTFGAKYNAEMLPQITSMSAVMGRALKSDTESMMNLLKTADGSFRSYMPELSDMEFMERIAGGVSGAVKLFATDGEEMRQALKNMGGEGSARGLALSDQLTALGMLQSAGLSGSEAATAFKGYAVSAAKADEHFMSEGMNIRLLDDNNQMLETYEVLKNIRAEFGDKIEAKEFQLLKEGLGSDEAVKVFTNLLPLMDQYKKNQADIADLAGQGMGVVNEMAAGVENSDDAKLQRAAEELATLRREIGTALVPIFTDMIPILQDFSAWFRPFVKEHKALIKFIGIGIVAFGVFASVFGGLTIALASVLGPLAVLKFSLGVLGFKGLKLTKILPFLGKGILFVGKALAWAGRALLLNPIGLAITAIALGALLIIKYWKPIKGFFGKIWNGFKTLMAWSPLGLLMRGFGVAFKWLKSLFGTPKESAQKTWGFLKFLFSWSPLGLIKRGWSKLPDIYSAIFSKLKNLTGAAMDKIKAFISAPMKLIGKFKKLLSFKGFKDKVKMPEVGTAIKTGAAIGGVALAPAPALAQLSPGPNVSNSPLYAPAPAQVNEGDIIIHVHGAPGMNETTLAKLVAAEVAKINRQKTRRKHSALSDIED